MGFIEHDKSGFIYLTASNIDTPHAFTTRYGGVSEGIFSSMNLSLSGKDSREYVEENYRIMCDALNMPMENIIRTKQVHKTNVRAVTADDCVGLFDCYVEDSDGLLTDVPGIPLIAFTADCIPILLYDPVRRVIGAVHAGWRGTTAGIAEIALLKMASVYGSDPKDVRCAIGPGIGSCCFETDRDVPEAILNILGREGEQYFRPEGAKYYADIKGVNKALLIRAGALEKNIEVSDECSMCLNEKYWSHRYTKGRRGNQACVIMLRGTEN